MKWTKVSLAIDRLLLFLVTAFLGFAVASFFSRDSILIIMVGVTIALCLTSLVTLRRHKKQSGLDAKAIKLSMLQFFLKPTEFALDTVFNALKGRYKDAKVTGGYIVIKRVVVYPHLHPKQLTVEKFCDIYKNLPTGARRLIILTGNGISVEASRFIASTDFKTFVTVLKPDRVYTLLNRLSSLPHIEFNHKPARRTIRLFFKEALSPPVARRYLLTALLLIGSSFFMPASIYFIVVGSVCVVLSVLAALDVGSKF